MKTTKHEPPARTTVTRPRNKHILHTAADKLRKPRRHTLQRVHPSKGTARKGYSTSRFLRPVRTLYLFSGRFFRYICIMGYLNFSAVDTPSSGVLHLYFVFYIFGNRYPRQGTSTLSEYLPYPVTLPNNHLRKVMPFGQISSIASDKN